MEKWASWPPDPWKPFSASKLEKVFFEKCEAAFFPEKLLTDRSDKTQLASANQFSSPHFSFCIHHICGRLGDPINPWSLWNISRCHVLSPKNLRRFFVTPKKKCRDSPHDSMLVYSWFTWLFSYYLSPLSWCFPWSRWPSGFSHTEKLLQQRYQERHQNSTWSAPKISGQSW